MAAGVSTSRHYVEPSFSGLAAVFADSDINRPFHKGPILLRACSGLSPLLRVAPPLCSLPLLTLPVSFPLSTLRFHAARFTGLPPRKSLRLPLVPCLDDN